MKIVLFIIISYSMLYACTAYAVPSLSDSHNFIDRKIGELESTENGEEEVIKITYAYSGSGCKGSITEKKVIVDNTMEGLYGIKNKGHKNYQFKKIYIYTYSFHFSDIISFDHWVDHEYIALNMSLNSIVVSEEMKGMSRHDKVIFEYSDISSVNSVHISFYEDEEFSAVANRITAAFKNIRDNYCKKDVF